MSIVQELGLFVLTGMSIALFLSAAARAIDAKQEWSDEAGPRHLNIALILGTFGLVVAFTAAALADAWVP